MICMNTTHPYPEHRDLCGKPVEFWRACWKGCPQSFAYCDEHGGNKRAALEAERHILAVHDPFCPMHGRQSRPTTTEGLLCDGSTKNCREKISQNS